MKTLRQIEDLLGDVEFAFGHISDALKKLEMVDWHEIFSHVPDSDKIQGEIELAIDNIKDNINDLNKGVNW